MLFNHLITTSMSLSCEFFRQPINWHKLVLLIGEMLISAGAARIISLVTDQYFLLIRCWMI